MLKKFLMLFSVISVLCLLTGCTSTMSRSDSTGSIEIRYSSAAPFQRAPVFSEADGILHMKFSGYEWYTAQIITNKKRDSLVEGREVLAETANMKLYDTSDDSDDDYRYTYIFEPDEDIDYCIRFDTDDEPSMYSTYGNDFTEGVQYFANGTEIVPDIPTSMKSTDDAYPEKEGPQDEENGMTVTLTYESFDGGGPEYTVSVGDETLVSYSRDTRYKNSNSGDAEGSGYYVIFEFTGLVPGETEVTIQARSPIADNFDEIYSVSVDSELKITMERKSYIDILSD